MESAKGNTDTTFDLFVFAVSWAPQFCCWKREKCRREKLDQKGNSLVPHGLWPTRFDGSRPENCNHDAGAQEKLSGRRKHEYSKHGSCAKLSAAIYFTMESQCMQRPEIKTLSNVINLRSKTWSDDSTSDPPTRVLEVDELHRAIKHKIGVKSSPLCQLQELTLCYEKTPSGLVGHLIDCPAAVLEFRNSVRCNRLVVENSASDRDMEKCSFLTKEVLRKLIN